MKKEFKMSTDDFLWWGKFREVRRRSIKNDEYRTICEIHSRVFEHDIVYVGTCCSEYIQAYIDDLNEIYSNL
jgi:hypothetical protein